jgi:2-polyprenyl-3-methyl-5-hydroxy-6-metoxy-1,4-benzoquinol methylase
LARRGYHVWGADRSPELIAIAQKKAIQANLRLEFVIGDLVGVTFTRLFDAILCRGVLNDLVKESDRTAIFRQFAVWLRPGGVAIFDVREWTRTVARYEKNSVHRRTLELPDATLHFQRAIRKQNINWRNQPLHLFDPWIAFPACTIVSAGSFSGLRERR